MARCESQVITTVFSTTDHLLVAVVDDDESVRESLPDLLGEFGFAARTFSSAAEFLSSDSVGQTKCLILDIFMPGMTGLDLQRELRLRGQQIPIIFVTRQKMRLSARKCSNRVLWNAFSNHSATRPFLALNKALRAS